MPCGPGIAATTSSSGLRVRSEIDKREYPKGIKVTNEQMGQIALQRHRFHGDWNYTIRPDRGRSREV